MGSGEDRAWGRASSASTEPSSGTITVVMSRGCDRPPTHNRVGGPDFISARSHSGRGTTHGRRRGSGARRRGTRPAARIPASRPGAARPAAADRPARGAARRHRRRTRARSRAPDRRASDAVARSSRVDRTARPSRLHAAGAKSAVGERDRIVVRARVEPRAPRVLDDLEVVADGSTRLRATRRGAPAATRRAAPPGPRPGAVRRPPRRAIRHVPSHARRRGGGSTAAPPGGGRGRRRARTRRRRAGSSPAAVMRCSATRAVPGAMPKSPHQRTRSRPRGTGRPAAEQQARHHRPGRQRPPVRRSAGRGASECYVIASFVVITVTSSPCPPP